MKISESFGLALKNIWGRKVRSFLTMLGIIIGIAAVMIIVGMGTGIEGYMADQFEAMGSNNLTVMVSGSGSSRTLSVDDMFDIIASDPTYFNLVSPIVSLSGKVKIGDETMSRTSVSGVAETYLSIENETIETGRNLRYMDMVNRSRVCVIGEYLASTYFDGKAVGEELRINGSVFTIVGVLTQIDDEMDEGGSDDVIYIPYSTASRLSGSGTVSNYTVTIVNKDDVNTAVDVLEAALYDVFGTDESYTVTSMSSMLDTMNEMVGVVITILVIIAGISLVVGGIGIMNIMLVSVSERTKEIGIRKALGAKERYILAQFVIEAAVTSAIGGLIGIAMGYLLSAVATVIVTNLMSASITVGPTVTSAALAFGASAGIGVLFGYLPAKKAAVLNPIDALRYE